MKVRNDYKLIYAITNSNNCKNYANRHEDCVRYFRVRILNFQLEFRRKKYKYYGN
ncbi:MAG: hypothetical protein K0S23_1563 [Fluviicola sp.]|jgi:hypothetical protein|nr:hypothetical protein [Fluviicola sp.]